MTRLLLIGLLTVLSFSVNSFDEQPVKPWVEPKNQVQKLYNCNISFSGIGIIQSTLDACLSTTQSSVDTYNSNVNKEPSGNLVNYTIYENLSIVLHSGTTYRVKGQSKRFYYICSASNCNPLPPAVSDYVFAQASFLSDSNVKECPPDSHPEYTVGPVPESDENPSHEVCKPKFTPCPLGYFKNQVTNSSGQNQCVPVSCPDKGTRVNNVFNKDGILTVGSSGTYCDGKCSYTIQPSDVPYNGSSFSFGTSNGQVCGQGDYANIKFTPTDKENSCTTHTLSNGSSYQECSEGDGTEPEEDNAEGDLSSKAQDASVDDTTKPSKYSGADCSMSEDKLFCVGTEIIEALDHQTAETKKQQDEKHNKLVNLQKDIAEYVETQQRERSTLQNNQSQLQTDLIVSGLTQITTAINNSGSGNGDNNESLTENYNPDSQQVDDAFSQSRSNIESAASDLDSLLSTHNSFYSPNSGFWDSFQGISNLLPSDVSCTNPEIDFKDLHMTVDLCSKADLIKAFLGFAMIFATLFRVLYQTQTVLRIVAESKA